MAYLFDTNTVIDYLSSRMPPQAMIAMHNIVNNSLLMSVITRIESLGFDSGNPPVNASTKAFVNLFTVFDLTPDIVQQTIDLKLKKKIKTPDAIIAATALVHGLTLLSRNLSDFKNIAGLTVIDPHTLL